MPKRTAAFAIALLLAVSLGLGAERKTWVAQVRFYSLRAFKAVGHEVEKWMTSMRGGIRSVRRGVAKSFGDLTTAGRRGVSDLKKITSRFWRRTRRGAHEAMTKVARGVVPVGTAPVARREIGVPRRIRSPILDPLFLRAHDILLAWHASTGGRPIRRSLVLDDRVVLEDGGHELYSFGSTNGIIQWVYPLPTASQCDYRADELLLFVIAEDTLFEIDRVVGRPRRRIVFRFPIASAPTFHENLVVVGSWDRRVYAINRTNRVREWTFFPPETPEGGAAVVHNMAYIGDAGGALSAYSPAARRVQWTYKADDAIRVPVLLHREAICFPAEDLFIHCVNRFGGFRLWKFPVQGAVRQQPWIENGRVYFAAENDAFYAISRDKGQLIWRCPGGGWPVAVGRDNIYLQGANNEIWCLDRKTGKRLWSVSAKPFDHFVRNTDTDYIYLCADRGEVYALYLRGDHIEKKVPPPEKKLEPRKKPPPKEPEPGEAPGEEQGPAPATP